MSSSGGCATQAGDVDSESHFVCGSDVECVSRGDGTRCVSGRCVAPAVDLTDSRASTTPDCVGDPCSGRLRDIYRAMPPDGAKWIPGVPLLATTSSGSVVLLLEEQTDEVAQRVAVGFLSADLDERFWRRWDLVETSDHTFWDNLMFTHQDQTVVAQMRTLETGEVLLEIATLDDAGQPAMERTATLPLGAFLKDVAASGAVTFVRSDRVVGVEGPSHPDCASANALLISEPDDTVSVLRCPKGANFGRFEAGPSGYTLGGGVHGNPPGTTEVNLGDGSVRLENGAPFLARYDRQWRPVWTKSYSSASLGTGVPAPGGGQWVTLTGGDQNTGMGELGLPPDPYGTRYDLVYLGGDGNPRFAVAREGENHGSVLVDGAGHAVVWASGQPSEEGIPSGWDEIRKILLDGTTAWRIPIEWAPMRGDYALGPQGDVYVAVLPAEGETVTIDGEVVSSPELAVLRFAP